MDKPTVKPSKLVRCACGSQEDPLLVRLGLSNRKLVYGIYCQKCNRGIRGKTPEIALHAWHTLMSRLKVANPPTDDTLPPIP